MKAGYVLKGGPRWPKQPPDLERIGWEANDPQIDFSLNGGINVIEPVRANGYSIFLGRDPVWENYSETPEVWAGRFSKDITRLGLEGKQCAFLADIEIHDSSWIYKALRELRRIRSGRGLAWSMEPIQAGIISDDLKNLINNDPLVSVAPQLYRGNMSPVSERWVLEDLESRGIKREKIFCFYGSRVEGFNGYLYDLNAIG